MKLILLIQRRILLYISKNNFRNEGHLISPQQNLAKDGLIILIVTDSEKADTNTTKEEIYDISIDLLRRY